MNERFFQHLSVVTIVHVSVVALLVFAAFFRGRLLSRFDKNEPTEFVVDVIPTQEGPAGRDTETVLPETEPESQPAPAPVMALEPAKESVKKPEQEARKLSDKPKKEPIKRSTKTVVRVNSRVVHDKNKGSVSHFNPLSEQEIKRRLALGAKASDHTVIPGEDQRQKLIVKNVLYDSWVPPSKADAGDAVTVVRLWFGDGGWITKWKMESKSNVPVLDDSVTRLLENIRQVPGLSQDFINQYRLRGFTADFSVQE